MEIKKEIKGIGYNINGIDDAEFYAGYEDDIPADVAEQQSQAINEMIENNELAQKEWEQQGENNIKKLIEKQQKIVHKYKIAKSDKKTVAVFDGESYIGERIAFLLDASNQEIAEFSRNIGMSRSSLHRYIKGTFLPSEKSLRRIIDGLFISVADFCYEPDNFQKWKSSFEKSNDVSDIFTFREKMLKALRINNFSYTVNGATVRLPNRYFETVRTLLTDAFNVLDLLPHDKK